MNLFNWLIPLVSTVVLFLLFIFFKKQIENQIENKFTKLSQDALKSSQEQFLVLADERLGRERKLAQSDLDLKKQAVENVVKGLREELEKYKILMHDFEQDRTKKYGSLENELKKTSTETSKLQDTTNHLTNILANVKLRGQWGERMAEDIIRGCGLVEGINYEKQSKQDSTGTTPDYTFLLPDDHKINMDVKFPLNNYLNFVNAKENAQKEQSKKEFIKNVHARIKEIQGRDYVNPAENTLDFVLLFIPNEQVFGFIQENIPGLMDEALKQKVVLCSPFTLYAMLSVIRKSFENFHYEKSTKEIIKRIDLFSKTYEIFKNRFEQLGDLIGKLEGKYDDINAKSFKELDTKMKRINNLKKGQAASLDYDNDIIEVHEDSLDNELVQ